VVHVIDARSYVGGNCHTRVDSETGITVHVHGPHIFHTDDERVWSYVNSFSEFEPYITRVKATTRGAVYGLPINLHTINQFYRKTLSPEEAKKFIAERCVQMEGDPETFEDQALKFVGAELYEAFFRGYAAKQWGLPPSALPASVFKRLPIRYNYDDNYFSHKYQGIPIEGYTQLVKRILASPKIQVRLNERYTPSSQRNYNHIFYSGPLDGWFDYKLGRLGYRTLRFETSAHSGDFQGCAVMSYPEEKYPFTRITEHKHFQPWKQFEKTIVSKEYSASCGPSDDPYYPIRLVEEQKLLNEYIALAGKEQGVSFVGRLGTYRYLDMDVTIGEALNAAEMFLEYRRTGQPIPQFFSPVS
jgi:UDP-galactopyranose mutase